MRCFLIILFSSFLTNFLAQNAIQKEGWELTFNDEFNNKKIDFSKWQDLYYWGGRFNKGDLTYYGKDQFDFTDSTLIIKAEEKETKKGFPYTSGMLDGNQSFKQQYGYFEIRCKLPNSTGFWPAFWLVSTESWPPEVDIFEIYTSEPDRISASLHWLNKNNTKKRRTKNRKIEDSSKGFHTYAVEWTPKKIVWYADGEKVTTLRRGVKYFSYKMHIIVNLNVSDFKGMNLKEAIFPNTYEIDYIRVYKRKS